MGDGRRKNGAIRHSPFLISTISVAIIAIPNVVKKKSSEQLEKPSCSRRVQQWDQNLYGGSLLTMKRGVAYDYIQALIVNTTRWRWCTYDVYYKFDDALFWRITFSFMPKNGFVFVLWFKEVRDTSRDTVWYLNRSKSYHCRQDLHYPEETERTAAWWNCSNCVDGRRLRRFGNCKINDDTNEWQGRRQSHWILIWRRLIEQDDQTCLSLVSNPNSYNSKKQIILHMNDDCGAGTGTDTVRMFCCVFYKLFLPSSCSLKNTYTHMQIEINIIVLGTILLHYIKVNFTNYKPNYLWNGCQCNCSEDI